MMDEDPMDEVRQLDAKIDRMRELLVRASSFIGSMNCATGVCCCGSPVDKHGMGDGHSPVDEGEYHAGLLLDDIKKELQ